MNQPTTQIGHPQPSLEAIKARAYELFLKRGGQPGRAQDDWLQAEYELTQLPIRKLAELAAATPPPTKSKRPSVRRGGLLDLVQVALLLGSTALR